MIDRQSTRWPKTVGEAADMVIVHLSIHGQDIIRSIPREALVQLHLGLGTYIRNRFGLNEGNRDLLASCGSPDMQPDEASTVVIEAVWEQLQGQAAGGPL